MQAAEGGGSIATQAVEAMTRVEAAAREISDINHWVKSERRFGERRPLVGLSEVGMSGFHDPIPLAGRRKLEFPAFDHGGGLGAPLGFCSRIDGLLPMARTDDGDAAGKVNLAYHRHLRSQCSRPAPAKSAVACLILRAEHVPDAARDKCFAAAASSSLATSA